MLIHYFQPTLNNASNTIPTNIGAFFGRNKWFSVAQKNEPMEPAVEQTAAPAPGEGTVKLEWR